MGAMRQPFVANSLTDVRLSLEYQMVEDFYGESRAVRSGVLKMNHIDEGLQIMWDHGARGEELLAFCIHPLIQHDDDMAKQYKLLAACDPLVVLYAVEYRRAANAYLCEPRNDSLGAGGIAKRVGVLVPEVRLMLIGDKIQNQKDFRLYHAQTHPRRREYAAYFGKWRRYLGVPECNQLQSTT